MGPDHVAIRHYLRRRGALSRERKDLHAPAFSADLEVLRDWRTGRSLIVVQAGKGRTDRASRGVAASCDDVYRAFASAEALIAWLPPGDMTGRVLEYDFREGGRYRIELSYSPDAPTGVGKSGERTDVSTGRFLRLSPGKRIVQSVEFESSDASFAGDMTITWSFEPSPTAGTQITVTAENVPPGISQADHDAGLRSSLENLAQFLTTTARGS